MDSGPSLRPVRFLLGGKVIEVADFDPTTSVLDYLRGRASRPGTKEGCAEGDCGACTVVIGDLEDGRLRLRAENACIKLLPTLDGKALFSVEDLRCKDGTLHPVQQALVDCHGSQCGFCTPGFVMSLWALYQERSLGESENQAVDESAVRRAISGNLCRCTGYRPIIEAGTRMMGAYPRIVVNAVEIEQLLNGLTREKSLVCGEAGNRFHAPRSLNEFLALRAQMPQATILAGGTDVGLWINKQLRNVGNLIYTGEVAELKRSVANEDGFEIGAAVSLSAAWQILRADYPELDGMWGRFASEPIRNSGTLGGNIANGSPIGDAMPPLMALGARVELASVGGSREIPLEKLYVGYQQKAMARDEVLVRVHIPRRRKSVRVACYKVSKRFDSDISAVCAAMALEVERGDISHCRIAFGGMAATPVRALKAEANLLGKTWNEVSVRAAMVALAAEFTPISDARASALYRLECAQNLLYRFFLETREQDPLPAWQSRVFD